jgi:succinate dehydrogenase / fumarate reductase cytochrome b subunit
MDKILNNKRPLSPHLQIYKPQLTSVMSISHRFTGVILSLLLLLIPFFFFVISLGSEYFNILVSVLDHFLVKLILYGVIFVVTYHLLNGVRHLFWDIGKGLSIKDSYLSGYLVIALSLLTTLFFIVYLN